MNKLLVVLTLLFTISCSKSDATIDEARKSLEKQYPNIQKYTPNYHIASYLGITPESLSRIRIENTK